jgi:PAS domain S-box-containing protein
MAGSGVQQLAKKEPDHCGQAELWTGWTRRSSEREAFSHRICQACDETAAVCVSRHSGLASLPFKVRFSGFHGTSSTGWRLSLSGRLGDQTVAQGENPNQGTDAWRLQLLINSVVDYAIFQIDKEGVVTTWNSGAQRIKGYTADEIIGRHFSLFYTEEDRQTGIPMRNLAIAAREGKCDAEGWRVRKDGSRFWALVVIDPIRDEAGELVGFAKVTRDITERMEAQRALRETQEQLAASAVVNT